MLALLLLSLPARSAAGAPSLSLEEAYRRALARSPEFELLGQRIAEAETNVDRAWAILQPQLTGSYTFTVLAPAPAPITFPDLTSDDVQNSCRQGGDPVACIMALQASLENPVTLDLAEGDTHLISGRVIWNPINGRALPTIANAYASVDVERDRTDAQRQQLLLGVARAFYAASATRGAIAAADRARARTIEQLGLVRARAELGERASTVVTTAEIAARQAALDLARARNAHAQALLALWSLTRSDDHPEITDPPLPVPPPGSRDELLVEARRLRKDLSAADKSVVIAERAKDEVWWRFAPVLGVFGGYRYSNVRGLSGQNSQWSFGVAATIDLYDGLRYADLEAADAHIATALITRRTVDDRIANDVERALLALEGADLNVSRAQEALNLAEQTLDLTKAQYEVGAVRSVELNDANDHVLDAEVALIHSNMERAVSVLELQYAVGLFDPKP